MTTHKTFCRVCTVFCAMEADVEDGRVVAVRGDRTDPMHGGYTCIKGQQIIEQHEHPERLRGCLRRSAQNRFEPISSTAALDEIAERLKGIIDRHGPRAVAVYMGTHGGTGSGTMAMLQSWLQGIGSPSYYTPMSIDQPAKFWVAPSRHGVWSAGLQHMDTADVAMVVGANPLVSHWSPRGGLSGYNPTHRLREARKRGMKLIVIDPRRTELARHADLHLRVKPGEDPTLLCGILRVLFEEGLYDREFCGGFTVGFEALRDAVQDFTPDYVEQRTGVPVADMVAAARMFGQGPRGVVSSGTGPDMSPRANLSEHLIASINTLCGRYRRAGEAIPDMEVLYRSNRHIGQVIPPWFDAPAAVGSRIRNLRGAVYTGLDGRPAAELPASALADEILTPGDGQVRALIVVGGNPLVAFPNQDKVRRAMQSLDLLVAIDIKLSATSKLAHYVLAPKLSFERADVAANIDARAPAAYMQYTEALAEPDFDVVEEWEVFRGLARRLATPMRFAGGELPLAGQVSKLDLLKLIYPDPRVPWDTLTAPGGRMYPEIAGVVEEPQGPSDARLQFAPAGIVEEIREVRAEALLGGAGYGEEGPRFTHRLICPRLAHSYNSSSRDGRRSQAKGRTNYAYMNPADLAAAGLRSGDRVTIASAHASIPGVVAAADDVLPGTISMSHGYGDTPEFDHMVAEIGSSTSRLADDETDYDPVMGMPRFSAIPVNVEALERAVLTT